MTQAAGRRASKDSETAHPMKMKRELCDSNLLKLYKFCVFRLTLQYQLIADRSVFAYLRLLR